MDPATWEGLQRPFQESSDNGRMRDIHQGVAYKQNAYCLKEILMEWLYSDPPKYLLAHLADYQRVTCQTEVLYTNQTTRVRVFHAMFVSHLIQV